MMRLSALFFAVLAATPALAQEEPSTNCPQQGCVCHVQGGIMVCTTTAGSSVNVQYNAFTGKFFINLTNPSSTASAVSLFTVTCTNPNVVVEAIYLDLDSAQSRVTIDSVAAIERITTHTTLSDFPESLDPHQTHGRGIITSLRSSAAVGQIGVNQIDKIDLVNGASLVGPVLIAKNINGAGGSVTDIVSVAGNVSGSITAEGGGQGSMGIRSLVVGGDIDLRNAPAGSKILSVGNIGQIQARSIYANIETTVGGINTLETTGTASGQGNYIGNITTQFISPVFAAPATPKVRIASDFRGQLLSTNALLVPLEVGRDFTPEEGGTAKISFGGGTLTAAGSGVVPSIRVKGNLIGELVLANVTPAGSGPVSGSLRHALTVDGEMRGKLTIAGDVESGASTTFLGPSPDR